MSIYDNSTTLGYIRIVGAIVAYNNEIYTIPDFITNKKYIYWTIDNPYRLLDTNVMPTTSQSTRLVVINDFGMHTVVPSTTDNFTITFDGDSKKNIDKKLQGLYEKDEFDGERFSVIESDIEGFRTLVGNTEEIKGTLVENITRIDQKADGISLEVDKTKKELDDSEIRDHVNKSLIDLHSALGIFKSELRDYTKDSNITDVEMVSIESHFEILVEKKSVLYQNIDKVLEICNENGNVDGGKAILSAKEALENAHKNLKTIVDNCISDSVITPSDETLISNGFAQYSLKINELKNTLDDVILLGMGGVVSEELARISMTSNEISLNVDEIVTETIASLEIGGVNLLNNGVQFIDKDYWDGEVDPVNYVMECDGIIRNTTDVKLEAGQEYVLSLSVELPEDFDLTVNNLLNYMIKYE